MATVSPNLDILEDVRRYYDGQLRELKERHGAELEAFRQKHQTAMAAMEAEHERTLDLVARSAHRRRMAAEDEVDRLKEVVFVCKTILHNMRLGLKEEEAIPPHREVYIRSAKLLKIYETPDNAVTKKELQEKKLPLSVMPSQGPELEDKAIHIQRKEPDTEDQTKIEALGLITTIKQEPKDDPEEEEPWESLDPDEDILNISSCMDTEVDTDKDDATVDTKGLVEAVLTTHEGHATTGHSKRSSKKSTSDIQIEKQKKRQQEAMILGRAIAQRTRVKALTMQATAMEANNRSTDGAPRFACPEMLCRESFPTLDGLKRHLRCHSGERPMTCPCTKIFQRKLNFDKHREVCKMMPEKRRNKILKSKRTLKSMQ